MYLISLIPPIMVILFSLGIFSLLALFVDLHKIKENSNTIKKKFIKWIPLVVVIFILASQLAFTYPTYASGDYQGLYKPVDPPQPMINAGIFLENSTGYNAIVAPSVQYPPPATIWNSTYSLLQLLSTYKNSLGINAYTANNSEFLTHIYYLGVQHLVIINIYNNYQPIINKALNSSSLSLSFHQGFIFIFTVNSFKQILQSRGLFLDFNYPFSNVLLDQWNSTIVNLPYFGQNISPKYVDGVIGINITILDLIALFSSNYSINLYNIVHRYSSNPSSPGSNWGCDISYFPSGAEGIAINGEFNRTVAFDYSQGKYIVLVNGFTFQPPKPSDKNYSLLSICSGNEKITANFASLSLPYYQSSIWIDSGSINSTGLIYLKNNGPLYITSIRMIPVIQYNILRNEAISFAQNISIISAEHSKGCLGKLISNYTYSRNTTLYEYPYLVIRLEPSRANPVTLIINPGSNTFGVPDRILQSPEPIYTKYYIDTTYYSIVLGSRYNFSEYGIVNPFYIGMLNIFTLSLVIVIPSAGIRIIDKRKGISEKKKIKSW